MRNRVSRFIEREKLLNPSAKVIVGFSGGADSVVLLNVLHQLGYLCLAAHCNFHLRGEESMRDERFARDYAESLGIAFLKQDFDTPAVAQERGISIEMAARDLRYEWFEQLCEEEKADAIAVAHHQNDSVETLLLNLIRGTGIAGVGGIKPRNNRIVRPLLCVSREEIEQYAAENDIPYVTDSTNLEDEFTRNKIRLQVLPLLKTINPSVETSLLHTMDNLREAGKIYEVHIAEAIATVYNKEKGMIDIPALLSYPSPESILFELLKDYGFNKDVVREVYESIGGQSGKVFYSHRYRLIKDRNCFVLEERLSESDEVYSIHEGDMELQEPFPVKIMKENYSIETTISRDQKIATLDIHKLKFPLTLRRWQAGDRFVPFGMNGSQKLSDYFNNNKFSLREKENTWILCSGEDIVWIVGYRIDNRFRVDEKTEICYILKLL